MITAVERRRLWSPAGLGAALGSLAPPPSRTAELTVARRAMACEFSVILPGGRRGAVDAACSALDEVQRLEQKLSAYLADSDLSHVNQHASAGAVRVDGELFHLLRAAVALSAATGGAFDAASGALVEAWGFFRGPRRVPAEPERLEALAAGGSRNVILNEREQTVRFARPGLRLNLGGIGKGFAIDRALRLVPGPALMQGGQSSLKGIGAPAGQPRGWPVDIGHSARVWLRNRALGTSGAANQFFVHQGRRYGHVLDPRTGWPARGLLSASAVAPTALEADALSTAFFVLGVEGTRRFCRHHPEVSALLVVPSGAAVRIGAADIEVLHD